MNAKQTVLVAAIVLAGCRGAVREPDMPAQVRAEATAVAPSAKPLPLRLDRVHASDGACSALRPGASSGRDFRKTLFRAMDRVPIASSSGQAVTSAWRISADSEKGPGTILRVDGVKATGAYYYGEGIFAGCDQSSLERAYAALIPENGTEMFELMQLG